MRLFTNTTRCSSKFYTNTNIQSIQAKIAASKNDSDETTQVVISNVTQSFCIILLESIFDFCNIPFKKKWSAIAKKPRNAYVSLLKHWGSSKRKGRRIFWTELKGFIHHNRPKVILMELQLYATTWKRLMKENDSLRNIVKCTPYTAIPYLWYGWIVKSLKPS